MTTFRTGDECRNCEHLLLSHIDCTPLPITLDFNSFITVEQFISCEGIIPPKNGDLLTHCGCTNFESIDNLKFMEQVYERHN